MAASKTTFHLTADQRSALLSRRGGRPQRRLGDEEPFRTMRETFDREGYVLVRGLLDDDALARVRSAGTALAAASNPGQMFSSLDFAPVFNFNEDESTGRVVGDGFREVALEGAIPALVATVLLGLDHEEEGEAIGGSGDDARPPTTRLRLLKDAFMEKGRERNHCGWHVDDAGFWPTDASSSGVNAWLALDDMPSKYGGGMAVSPGSHAAEWKRRAYEAIGSTPLLPPEGVSVASLGRMQTCTMASRDSKMNQLIEATKRTPDYRAGDCLLCHRWLFHRSVEVNDAGLEHHGADLSLKRYTIRYERGDARIVRGMCLEPAVLADAKNSGRTLDDACADAPYYPLCWPSDEERRASQLAEMEAMNRDALPAIREKRARAMAEFMGAMKKVETNAANY